MMAKYPYIYIYIILNTSMLDIFVVSFKKLRKVFSFLRSVSKHIFIGVNAEEWAKVFEIPIYAIINNQRKKKP